jgi:2-methylcitrate dehydratase PrpD
MGDVDGGTDPSRTVLSFVAGTSCEAIPAAVRDRLTRGVLDVLGAGVRGAARGGQRTPSWVSTEQSVTEAAYATGLAVHDGEPLSCAVGDFAVTCGWMVPVTLMPGATRRRSGRDLLTAMAVGTELAVRLGAVAGTALHARGLHRSMTAMLGATAAAARIMAAEPDQIGHALGIAACGTPSALQSGYQQPATVSRTYLAHASAQAVTATERALGGITGLAAWVTPWLSALAPDADPGTLVDRLGEQWRLVDVPGHAAQLDLLLARVVTVAREGGWNPGEIDGAVVHGGDLAALQVYQPASPDGEHLSVPSRVAKALMAGYRPTGPEELRRLRRRVQLATFGGSAVPGLTIRIVNGKQMSVTADATDGAAADIDPWDATVERFVRACNGILDPSRSQELVSAIRSLHECDDLRDLLSLLSVPARTGRTPVASPGKTPEVAPAAGFPAADALARFAATATFDSLPADVVSASKRSVLDAVGCALYGRAARTVAIIDQLATVGDRCEASVWHTRRATSAIAATLINGTAIHTTELSESFTRAAVHPGTSIVPAVLAVGEREGATGRDIVTAVAVGYEVAIRLGLAFGGILLAQGLHSPTLAGAFGAAAGVSRLLRLDPDQTAHALGITACRVPSAMWAAAFQHADIKDLFQAHAAAIAVEAADAARAGDTGPADWLERWFVAIPRRPRLDGLTETLGHFWWVASGGLHFKDLPVMAMAAPTLGAMRKILGDRTVSPDDVRRVVVESSGRIALNRTYPPQSIISARGSIPFLVAAILHHPGEFLDDPYLLHFLTEERIRDRGLDGVAGAVELRVDPEFDAHMENAWPLKFEARVTIHLADGGTLVGYDDTWHRTSTMRYHDVAAKFRAMCRGFLTDPVLDSVIDQVRRLDQLDNVRQIPAITAAAH